MIRRWLADCEIHDRDSGTLSMYRDRSGWISSMQFALNLGQKITDTAKV
jgi:hypothetical protein